jgi:dTDP-4-dehydrorhamnose reductase
VLVNILLLGKTGQLGWELERTLPPLGKLTALDYPDVDFTKPETLSDTIRNVAPDLLSMQLHIPGGSGRAGA